METQVRWKDKRRGIPLTQADADILAAYDFVKAEPHIHKSAYDSHILAFVAGIRHQKNRHETPQLHGHMRGRPGDPAASSAGRSHYVVPRHPG